MSLQSLSFSDMSASGGSYLVSSKLNVVQVLSAAQTELLELFGSPETKKVGGG